MKKKFLLPLLLLIVAALALGIAACGGSDDNGAGVTVTLDKTELSLTEGEDVTLQATCSDSSLTVEWESSNRAVATVAAGKVTAVSAGTAVITAKAGGASATCSVTVAADTRPILTVVKINGVEQTSVQLLAGLTAQLGVQLTRGGNALNAEFAFDSSNKSVATVNADGLITAVARGTAQISYSASFGGKDYNGSVSVEVNPDILVSFSATALDLCALEGDDTYEHTATLTAMLALDGVEQDSSKLTVESENPNVASISNGTVTGLKRGTTRIVATYVDTEDNEEYKAYATVTVHAKTIEMSGKAVYSLYDITDGFDIEVEGLEGTVNSVTLGSQEVTFTASSGKVTVPKTQVQKSGYYTVSVITDTLEFTQQAVIADKVINTAAELSNWPYYVRPADWGANKANTYDGLVVLGDDIDYHAYSHGTVNSTGWYRNELLSNISDYFKLSNTINNWKTWITSDNFVDGFMQNNETVPAGATELTAAYSGTFTGTFDGLGHTVSGLVMRWNGIGFLGTESSGTIKNVAFTNCVVGYNSNFVSLISQRFNGTAENLFIEGSVPKTCLGNNVALVSGRMQSGAKLTNVVCVLSHSGDQNTVTGSAALGIVAAGAEVSAQANNYANVIGIGFNKPAVKSGSNVVVPGYNSVSDFLKSNPDLSWVDESEYWTKENGFPVFKTAATKINVMQPKLVSGTSTVSGEAGSLKAEAGGSVMIVGTGWTTKPWADVTWGSAWGVASNSHEAGLYRYGVTVNGEASDDFTVATSHAAEGDQTVLAAEIFIPSDTAEGSKVVITATSLLTGETFSVEFTVTGAIIEHKLSGTALVAKNRTDSLTVAIELNDLSANISSVTQVLMGETDITAKASFAGKTLNIDMSAAENGVTDTITAVVKSGTATHRIIKDFEVVEFAIGTEEELTAFFTSIGTKNVSNAKTATKDKYTYAILTDNIDCGGKNYTNLQKNKNASRDFFGTLDGRGHTVANIKVTNGVFYGIRGISDMKSYVKNIAFVNLRTVHDKGGAMLVNRTIYAEIDNVFVQGYVNAGVNDTYGGFIQNIADGGTLDVTNFVTVSEFADELAHSAVMVAQGDKGNVNDAAFANGIAISSASKKFGVEGVKENNVNLYGDYAAMKEAVTQLPVWCDDYWTMDDGVPVFKSSVEFITKNQTVTVTGNNGETAVTATKATEFTANEFNVVWSVEGLSEQDYTLTKTPAACTLTLLATATRGTAFKLIAAYTDIWGVEHKGELSLTVGATPLAAPVLTADVRNKKITVAACDNVASYRAEIANGDNISTKEITAAADGSAEIDMSEYTDIALYKVTVIAFAKDETVNVESAAATVDYLVSAKLATPQNVQSAGGKIVWDNVEHATGYTVYFKNENENLSFNVTDNEYVIAAPVVSGRAYNVTVKATYSATPAIYIESDESEALALDPVAITFDIESVNVCTLEGDDIAHTATVSVTLIINGETSSEAVTLASEDESIATVDSNGVVTGVKFGTTRISATYAKDGKEYVAFIAVTVSVPSQAVALTELQTLDLHSSAAQFTVTLPSEMNGNVHEVYINGTKQTFTVENGKVLTSKTGITATGYNNTVKLVGDTKAYTYNAVAATKVINTAEELIGWTGFINPAGTALVVLGADMDLGGKDFSNDVVTIAAGVTFDGLGHTVTNVLRSAAWKGLCGQNMYGTVKNLAVVGVKFGAGVHAYVISQNFYGTAENVFLEGEMQENKQYNAFFSQTANKIQASGVTPKFTNIVVLMNEVPLGVGAAAIVGYFDGTAQYDAKNIIGIGGGGKALYNTAADAHTVAGYATVADFKAAENVDLSWAQDSEYWEIKDGVPVFKSAAKYLADGSELA